MKKSVLYILFFTLCAPIFQIGCQTSMSDTTSNGIYVSGAVVNTAKVMKFDYMGTLDRAAKGEMKAIKDFVEFHGATDGMEGINHGTTCLELIENASDDKFSSVCQIIKPTLKKVLLERLQQGASRTKKEYLANKSVEILYPMTFAALSGKHIEGGLNDGTSKGSRGGESTPVTPAPTEEKKSEKTDGDQK